MSQKLSFSSIASTLAVLSASGLVACGNAATPPAESAADAKEVPAATTVGAAAAVDTTDEVKPTAGATPDTAAPTSEAPKADAPAAGAAPAAATPAGTAPKPAGKKKAAGAKAGCGAGTCG